jgi:hypothetical protein
VRGRYFHADNTIYIASGHWYETGGLKSLRMIIDTLAHEGVHAWFGTQMTDDGGEVYPNPNHEDAMKQCVDSPIY